jgi:signal transduction histidine kinase/PAS domain-containing protein
MGYINELEVPCLSIDDDRVVEVSEGFEMLTGYTTSDLYNKSLEEVYRILRKNPISNKSEIQEEYHYIFTKSYCAIEVNISCENSSPQNFSKYYFKEKENSCLEEKFIYLEQLYIDNTMGVAVFSFPDGILLRGNQAYLDFLGVPYNKRENSIGKKLSEIVNIKCKSTAEKNMKEIGSNEKPIYINEYKNDNLKRGNTYWDVSLVPISIDGQVKYIVETTKDITDRVLNRQFIEEQKKDLETIIENMSDGLLMVDTEYRFTLLNEGARNYFNAPDSTVFTVDNFERRKHFDLQGNQLTLNQMPGHRVLRGERLKSYRIKSVGPNGTFYYSFSGDPIYDNNGKVVRGILCVRDVTENVKSEELISMQKEQLETIIDNISDEIYLVDKDLHFVKTNKAVRENHKIYDINKLEDLFERYKLYDAYNKEVDLKNIPISKLVRGEEIVNEISVIYNPDKRYFSFNAKPIFDEYGSFKVGVLTAKDVTTEFLYKKAIERQADLLYQIINNLDLPLLRISYPDLKILDVNQKVYKMAQAMYPEIKSVNCIKGKDLSSIITDFYEYEDIKYLYKAAEEKRTTYLKNKKQVIDGKIIYTNILNEPVFSLNGEVEQIILVMIDVTSEVTANESMEKTLKMQEEFFANISHELKTPLNVIYSTVQLFNMYCSSGSLDDKKDSIVHYMNSITQNCYRLSKLINNIVDMSKIEAGYYELNVSSHNIVEVIEEVVMSVTDYGDSRGLDIIFDTDVEEKLVACDPEKIERVILNLISNAIKFSNAGSKIVISTQDKGEFIEISVSDEGMGIDKKYINKIFDRYKQADKSLSRNAEGTGIGLSLVKSIVELHKGKVFVESELGKGSKFSVLLPTGSLKETDVAWSSSMMKDNKQNINIELSDII